MDHEMPECVNAKIQIVKTTNKQKLLINENCGKKTNEKSI